MNNLKLSPPWIIFVREVSLLFANDNEVSVEYDEQDDDLHIEVCNYKKYQALKQILPKEKYFGNVVIHIKVEYEDSEGMYTLEDMYKAVFENNPVLKYIYTFDTDTNPLTYVVFKKDVAQFWCDDMSDPHGVKSMLYQDIARDVFGNSGAIFSTDSDKDSGWTKKYFNNHATPEEIEQWEMYNGEGTFFDGSSLPEDAKCKNECKKCQVNKENITDKYPF